MANTQFNSFYLRRKHKKAPAKKRPDAFLSSEDRKIVRNKKFALDEIEFFAESRD